MQHLICLHIDIYEIYKTTTDVVNKHEEQNVDAEFYSLECIIIQMVLFGFWVCMNHMFYFTVMGWRLRIKYWTTFNIWKPPFTNCLNYSPCSSTNCLFDCYCSYEWFMSLFLFVVSLIFWFWVYKRSFSGLDFSFLYSLFHGKQVICLYILFFICLANKWHHQNNSVLWIQNFCYLVFRNQNSFSYFSDKVRIVPCSFNASNIALKFNIF